MDLSQTKLTRSEWNSIEIPTEKKELEIISMICKGYHDVNICHNDTLSLLHYLKITSSEIIHDYVFCTYLQKHFVELNDKYEFKYSVSKYKKNKMKKADIIRFSNTDKQLSTSKSKIFEFVIIDILKKMLIDISKKNKTWHIHYYSIYRLMKYNIYNINTIFVQKIKDIMSYYKSSLSITDMVKMSDILIEKNENILKYGDMTLYDHQKELYTICKKQNSKLISYIAPTGTGKTLSPLGLSMNHRVIFVCAARHVGLALAKAAISIEKKVAFAFGCNTADDIRLHYYAATDYIRNKRSGQIAKVDNSIGDKVEIMICDIKSYLCAMYYMLAFNKKEDMIMYWDEPTITMDYKEHEIHEIIHKNWKDNEIPNVVLSSATLPNTEEIKETIIDFKNKFDNAENYTVTSFDCKKTIPIINKEGNVEMPHYVCKNYEELSEMSKYFEKNKTILRYIDLYEIIKFITLVDENALYHNSSLSIHNYYTSIDMINMTTIKEHYLHILKDIKQDAWEVLQEKLTTERTLRYKSNIYVVTQDSHTLTDGPTIFLANDIDKISNFCIKSANIPDRVEKDIMNIIEYNNNINNKLHTMQKTVEDATKKDEEKEKKMSEGRVAPAVKQLMNKITELQRTIKSVELCPMFVPNTNEHLERYASQESIKKGTRPFTCDITEDIVEKIMLINDVDVKWKMLLLMGIGVFASHKSIDYIEVMKELAYQKKLFLIIATSDFIYGTNYQFCHSYISKDLGEMSQEKLIQAMGRVGRRNMQYDYTIRFRDNNLIRKLFFHENNKPEVMNMKRLFNS